MTWGIIPAAGIGSRIQPLAFSKELLPVGSRHDANGVERPRAVSEHLVERMLVAGATKIAFIISPGKSDILEYYGGQIGGATICYLVQHHPAGLCDAVFQAADSGEFIHLYTDEGAESGALQQLPAFQAFVAGAPDRHEQPATFIRSRDRCTAGNRVSRPARKMPAATATSAARNGTITGTKSRTVRRRAR